MKKYLVKTLDGIYHTYETFKTLKCDDTIYTLHDNSFTVVQEIGPLGISVESVLKAMRNS